jgi:hypothetical protein
MYEGGTLCGVVGRKMNEVTARTHEPPIGFRRNRFEGNTSCANVDDR